MEWEKEILSSKVSKLEQLFEQLQRSEIILEAENGDADFQNVPNSPLTPFTDTNFDASLPMPAELTVGLSYEFCDKYSST